MGSRPDQDGPLISELTKPKHGPGLSHPEPTTTITHYDHYGEILPGEFRLNWDEKLIHEFWIGPGSWYLRAEGLLKGDVGGDMSTEARLTLTATPGNAHPVTSQTAVSSGGTSPIVCLIKPQSQEAMHVTLTAMAKGTCLLSEVEIFADPE